MRRHRAARIWADHGWPILAGSLVAVGLIGLHVAYGPVALLLVPAGLWVFGAVVLYGLLADCGFALRRIFRTATVASAAVVGLVGLLLVDPVWGWVAATVGAVTSPPVLARASRGLRRVRRKARAQQLASRQASTRLDRAQVDRRFAELVEELERGPKSP